MLDVPTQRTYRVIVLILVGISVVALSLVAAALIVTRPPSAQQVAATLTVAALPRYTATPIPTPVPALPGVSPDLLLCDGQGMPGAWGHSAADNRTIIGYGALNQVGLVCFMSLTLAKECGLAVDEAVLKRSTLFFGKYAGTEIKIDDVEHVILKEDEVLGVLK